MIFFCEWVFFKLGNFLSLKMVFEWREKSSLYILYVNYFQCMCRTSFNSIFIKFLHKC